MHCRSTPLIFFLICGLTYAVPARAQFPPANASAVNDPLHRAQTSKTAGACSAEPSSSCAEAAAKILPQVLGPSPMQENLRQLTDEIGGRVTGSPARAQECELGPG